MSNVLKKDLKKIFSLSLLIYGVPINLFMIITNTIRKLRFEAGEMTQMQLAELTQVSRQTIVAVEAGKYTPSLELAFKIADAFGVPIGEVFKHEKDEAKN